MLQLRLGGPVNVRAPFFQVALLCRRERLRLRVVSQFRTVGGSLLGQRAEHRDNLLTLLCDNLLTLRLDRPRQHRADSLAQFGQPRRREHLVVAARFRLLGVHREFGRAPPQLGQKCRVGGLRLRVAAAHTVHALDASLQFGPHAHKLVKLDQ
jgi:hypothetical protein